MNKRPKNENNKLDCPALSQYSYLNVGGLIVSGFDDKTKKGKEGSGGDKKRKVTKFEGVTPGGVNFFQLQARKRGNEVY